VDRANFIKDILVDKYPNASKVGLVMDNLNINGLTSLYESLPPELAFCLAQRLEMHFTPKHGSWLNMAECELSALCTQCLERLIPDITTMRDGVNTWQNDRNNRIPNINWQFTTENARIRLRHLYQTN
jgi:transposase